MPKFWWALLFVQILLLASLHSSYADQASSTSQQVTIDPPLKQVRDEKRSAEDVICVQGLVLMKKLSDNSPACVEPNTAKKLVERGWGKMAASPNPSVFSNSVNYTSGQKVGVFTISTINQDNVTGYYNSPYPIEHTGLGVFTTMHVGDTLNPTCDGSAPLVITSINYPDSITVSTCKSTGIPSGGCPICLSADSTIKTPEGDMNVKEIKDGMTVLSTDSNGNIVKSKVIQTNRVFVGDTHKVIDLQLADGRELFVSANHPTYDGKTIAGLQVGENYDGSIVKSMKLVQYKYQYTYDILPDSTTGNYFANGILVGSTLKDSG